MVRRRALGLASLLLAGPLASLLLAGKPATAGVGTASFTALTLVHTNCHVSTTPVLFGRYDPIGANRTNQLNASGAITVACVKGTAPTIALGQGFNAEGGTRRMRRILSDDFLAYELYQPPSSVPGIACAYTGAVVWGSAGANLFSAAFAPSKNARSYQVCGSVPAGQNPRIGIYADIVVATVNF
jgi:spore coat protein U-like protein